MEVLISLFKSRCSSKEPELAESLEQEFMKSWETEDWSTAETRNGIPRSQGKGGRNPTSTHQGEGKYCYIVSSEVI